MFEERSTDAFREGHNCAQSVLVSFQDDPRFGSSLTLAHGASLGSGVAGTGCMCGVLSGSLLLINAYVGTLDLESGASQKLADNLSVKLMDKFKSDYGSTCCRVIKRNQNLESREARAGCTDMVGSITLFVHELIEEHRAAVTGQGLSHIAPIDMVAIGRRVAQGSLAGLVAGAGLGIVLAFTSNLPLWWPYVGLGLAALLGLSAARGANSLRIARGSLMIAAGFSTLVIGIVLFAGIESLSFIGVAAVYKQVSGTISLAVALVAAFLLFLARAFESVRFGL